MHGGLIKRRLGQYGGAWIASFLVVLLACLAGVWGLKAPFVQVANLMLEIALSLLTLGTLTALVLTFTARESLVAKLAVLALALLLFLPLLWAPVLGVVLTAKLTGHAVEYSGVYAQFRIVVAQLLLKLFSNSTRDAIWSLFQVVATVVGFIASAVQIWEFLRKGGARRGFGAA
ncbi:MAG: hypothetical protein JSR45_00240 [Proteobacteria bacterium]|nr:hypothetical protein [Pseudomonadota bacterium]